MRPMFSGWRPDAVDFYRRLEADNSKAFWTENKAGYDEHVRGPMLELSDEVAEEFGPLHVFRPHRDVRFSSDKTPYKTHLGAVTEGEGGAMYYVQLSATGLFVASGYYRMARDQLARFRAAVADEPGAELAVLLDALPRWAEVGNVALKTAPRGYPRDHPRVGLLRHDGLTIGRSFAPAAWLSTRRCRDRIVDTWRATAPVTSWLDRHVGPSVEAPPEAR